MDIHRAYRWKWPREIRLVRFKRTPIVRFQMPISVRFRTTSIVRFKMTSMAPVRRPFKSDDAGLIKSNARWPLSRTIRTSTPFQSNNGDPFKWQNSDFLRHFKRCALYSRRKINSTREGYPGSISEFRAAVSSGATRRDGAVVFEGSRVYNK